jgi:hypothetical protein
VLRELLAANLISHVNRARLPGLPEGAVCSNMDDATLR